MNSEESSADNLLSRLSAYSCKPKARPLENVCTEVLAWCLRNSHAFSRSFLQLVAGRVAAARKGNRFRGLSQFRGVLHVETQRIYRLEAEDASAFRERLIYDVEITTTENEFYVAIECKAFSPFGAGQLPDYAADIFRKAKRCGSRGLLVTLTRTQGGEDGGDVRITWKEISDLLQTNEPDSSAGKIVYRWFIDFLEQEGIVMTIDKLNSTSVLNMHASLKFAEQLKKFLRGLRRQDRLSSHLGQSPVATESDGDICWIGVYDSQSRAGFSLYVGFGFTNANLFMYVQRKVPGLSASALSGALLRANKNSADYGLKTEPGSIKFAQRITPNSKYDGSPEEMELWFLALCRDKALRLSGKQRSSELRLP